MVVYSRLNNTCIIKLQVLIENERLISQSAESTKINIHQMESISTNVMIMNDVCGKSVSLSLHPESILGQFHLASQVV